MFPSEDFYNGVKHCKVFDCSEVTIIYLYTMNYCFLSQNKNNFRFRIYYKAGGFLQEGGVSLGQGDEDLLHSTCSRNNRKG